MVNKFYREESRLIQTGCIVLAADVAGSLCWNRRKKDKEATEFQGGRAGTAHHMPAGPRQRKKRERGFERNQALGFILIWGRHYYTTGSLDITYCKHMLQVSSIFASLAQIELLSI